MMRNNSFFRRTLAAGLVLLMLLTGCSDGQSADIKSEYMDPGQIAANEYRTTTVKVGDFEINYSVDSRMTYRRARFMYWLHGEDHYQDLLVENEQVVEKGQVLATFEVDVSPADILERELAVTEAQGSLSSLATSYESRIAAKQTAMASLEGTEYDIAAAELNQIQSEYSQAAAAARARVSQAQKALDKLKQRQAENSLVAPYDGIVMYVARSYRAGDTVDTRDPVVVIAEIDSRAINFTNNNTFGSVPYMSPVSIIDQKSKKEYTGTVVSCRTVTGSEEDDVWVTVDQPLAGDELLGAVRISGTILKKTGVLLIDAKALKQEGNQYYVLVLKGTSVVSKTYVKVGGQNGGTVWISEGLEEGQTLVIE